MKLVSIIIPLFNRQELIKETLDSVLEQTYPHWECIIVDDISTDNSLEVVNQYAKSDIRFRIFQRENKPNGAPACRNIGLQKANGEYVVFLDSDDILTKDCLKFRIDYMSRNPQLDFVVFQIGPFYNGKVLDDGTYTRKMDDYLRAFLRHKIPWHTMAPLWKKEIVESVRGFQPQFPRLQDPEFHTRVLLSEPIFEVLEDRIPDAFYRVSYAHKKVMPGLLGFHYYIVSIYPLLKKCENFQVLKNELKGTLLGQFHYFYSNAGRKKLFAALSRVTITTLRCWQYGIINFHEMKSYVRTHLCFYLSAFVNLKSAKRKFAKNIFLQITQNGK